MHKIMVTIYYICSFVHIEYPHLAGKKKKSYLSMVVHPCSIAKNLEFM